MKKRLLVSIMFIFVFTFSGCGPNPKDATTIVKEFYAAINAHDLEKAMSYMADDAILCCNSKGELVNDRDEIRNLYQGGFYLNHTAEITDLSEKDGEVRYSYTFFVNGVKVASGTDGFIIINNGKIAFEGVESMKP